MSVATTDKPASRCRIAMPFLGIVLAWGILVSQTRHHWGGESYYNFGWFVPFLGIWLLIRNLAGVPAESPRRPGWNIAAAALALACVLPFHALSEVNPFWRLPLWIQAAGVMVFSLSAIHSLYGWNGVRRALFPLFFISTMIPWPYRLEVLLVQSLTGVVVALSLQGIHFLGYPVELAGNSFVLGELGIGVNEACSGIRSLQALFMVTLFLGSLFGQGTARRVAAVLILPVIVLVVNTGRAIFLALQVIENGQAAYDEWHDPAGYIAFGVSMVLIYACIELFNVGSDGARNRQAPDLKGMVAGLLQARLPRRAAVFAVLPVALYGMVEGWFRYHEARAPAGTGWDLVMPATEAGATRSAPIPAAIETALGYSFGKRYFHNLSPRTWCEVYYYGYAPDNRLASVSSYGHAPTICMESSGATMIEQYPDLNIQVSDGPALALRHYLFELRDGKTGLHIFWVVWERRNMNIPIEQLQSLDYRTQWIQLWKGRRDFSRQVLLISLTGVDSPERARGTVRQLLNDWLVGRPG